MEKWQKQIEEILGKHYQGNELSEQVKKANELVALTQEVEIPSGEDGWVVAQMLKLASEELRPLAAVYAGFQLGVCWERYKTGEADAR